MELDEIRLATADSIYENFDYSYSVADAAGWSTDGDEMKKPIFFEDPDDSSAPTILGHLTIRFEPGSSVPTEAFATVRGEDVGNIMGGELRDYVYDTGTTVAY